MPISSDQARAAKKAAKRELADLPELAGIGLTKLGDDYALKVNLRLPLPSDVTLPDRIAGVPLRVEVVGEIRKRL